MTTATKQVDNALARAILELPDRIEYDAFNPHGKYNYASADKMYQTIGKVLAKHGLTVWQNEAEISYQETPTGTLLVLVSYDMGFQTDPGKAPEHTERMTGSAQFRSAQDIAAARTYAMKYWLRSKMLIATGEPDTDAQDAPQGYTPSARSSDPKGRAQGGQKPADSKPADSKPKPADFKPKPVGDCPDHPPAKWVQMTAAGKPQHVYGDNDVVCLKETWQAYVAEARNRMEAEGLTDPIDRQAEIERIAGRTIASPRMLKTVELQKIIAQYSPHEEAQGELPAGEPEGDSHGRTS